MGVSKSWGAVLVVLIVLLAAAWALVLWMAVVVSETLINTLSYIVELAQMP